MRQHWAALAVLALTAIMSGSVDAQQAGTPPAGVTRSPGALGQNFPNPFNPETRIPFSVGIDGETGVCTDPNRTYRVSLRIYNTLTQLVAIPILQGGGQNAGQPLVNVNLACGQFTAFWDGTSMRTRQAVSSNVYIYVLEIDGRTAGYMKMLVTK
jgi:hypothetical protein